jgi:precorrin-3B synthase
MSRINRDRTDRCPGVLRPHLAADGAVVRLRVPGGQITASSLRALASVAEGHADGGIYLTSRGNVQLRGVAVAGGGCTWELVDAVKAAGLLPSETHELVRNIVASPLTGLSGGLMDLRPVVRAIDAGLRAVPAMASLPGRFLFVADDGRGDVAGMKADLTLVARSEETIELVGGRVMHRREVAREVVAACSRFLGLRGKEWHIDELPADLAARVRLPLVEPGHEPKASDRVETTCEVPGYVSGHLTEGLDTLASRRGSTTDYGYFPTHVSVLAPLGRLTSGQLRLLADQAPNLVVTPWRGVVVPGAGADALAALTASGLVAEAGSPWTRITACVGQPFCAKARGDTMAAARQLAETEPALDQRVHLVACERACGTPSGPHQLVLVQE